eukprot:907030-Rhodomonas_salina.5
MGGQCCPIETSTVVAFVAGLAEGAAYQFKVFAGNANEAGFETQGSDVVTGRSIASFGYAPPGLDSGFVPSRLHGRTPEPRRRPRVAVPGRDRQRAPALDRPQRPALLRGAGVPVAGQDRERERLA